ncbi:MAG: methylated-DNA--[protein]-cysteine S-methyltransferase [Actinobacteria bacterium]|nr:methylated-DNA--[protein]-cysteine S-methyltransferase [Actinomycetota bacterium]
MGALTLVRDDIGLTGLYLPTGRHPLRIDPAWVRAASGFDEVRRELAEYFAGERQQFTLTLHPLGTSFQQLVWRHLRQIGYAETSSYGRLAAQIGSPDAARAVGLANGRNPISIVVPCHRVIGADGSLTGYGGGLEAKRWLLAHEARHAGLTLL